MRKLMLAVAILPVFGGAALAAGGGGVGASPYAGRGVDTAAGPAAYPDWQQRWAQVRQDPAVAALLGLPPAQADAAAQSVLHGAAQPNG